MVNLYNSMWEYLLNTLWVCAFLMQQQHTTTPAALRARPGDCSWASTPFVAVPENSPFFIFLMHCSADLKLRRNGRVAATVEWLAETCVKMPVRATQTRAKWHERARSRTQQGTRAPLSPLARFLTSSGTLSGCSFRFAKRRSEVWIVVPVGVTGTRGRCAAFRSVQDAGDSPSPRCCSKSELSSASPPNHQRHLRRMMVVFDALWLLVWIRRKRACVRSTCFSRNYWIDGLLRERTGGFLFLCLIYRMPSWTTTQSERGSPGRIIMKQPHFYSDNVFLRQEGGTASPKMSRFNCS